MTFAGQSEPRQPFLRAPAVVIGLIIVLVGAHVARIYAFPGTSTAWIYNYGFVPARYSHAYLYSHGLNPGNFLERALPFVTYMFLHANYTHVVINCVWLLAFGPIVAARFGGHDKKGLLQFQGFCRRRERRLRVLVGGEGLARVGKRLFGLVGFA